jgi:hypothetical protein
MASTAEVVMELSGCARFGGREHEVVSPGTFFEDLRRKVPATKLC